MRRQDANRKDKFQCILEQREIIEAEQDWNIYIVQQRLKRRRNADRTQEQRKQELTMKAMMRKAKDREEALANKSKTLEKEIEEQKDTLKMTQRRVSSVNNKEKLAKEEERRLRDELDIACEALEGQIINLHRKREIHNQLRRARQESIDAQGQVIQQLLRVMVQMVKMEEKKIKERTEQEEHLCIAAQGEKLTKLSQELPNMVENFSEVLVKEAKGKGLLEVATAVVPERREEARCL